MLKKVIYYIHIVITYYTFIICKTKAKAFVLIRVC